MRFVALLVPLLVLTLAWLAIPGGGTRASDTVVATHFVIAPNLVRAEAPPGAAYGLSATTRDLGYGVVVDLTWIAPGATSYCVDLVHTRAGAIIYREVHPPFGQSFLCKPFSTNLATTVSWGGADVQRGDSLCFRVYALNQYGPAPASDELCYIA